MILSALMMDVICSSETSVLTRTTWYSIPEDGILHVSSHENLKSYTSFTVYITERQLYCRGYKVMEEIT
jgi:hypothetical protein